MPSNHGGSTLTQDYPKPGLVQSCCKAVASQATVQGWADRHRPSGDLTPNTIGGFVCPSVSEVGERAMGPTQSQPALTGHPVEAGMRTELGLN